MFSIFTIIQYGFLLGAGQKPLISELFLAQYFRTVKVLTFRSNQKDEQRKQRVGYDMELLLWNVLALTDFTSWLITWTWSW